MITNVSKKWRLNNPEKRLVQQRKYRMKHRDKINAYAKEWRLKNPEKFREKQKRYELKYPNRRRNKQYGIDIEEMKIKQKRTCAICGNKKKLLVDHCHKSNKVRGLLCNDCNLGLGRFFDSVDILEKAIKYLTLNI